MQSGGVHQQTSAQTGSQIMGPFKFSHNQLEKDGIIIESEVPENRFQKE